MGTEFALVTEDRSELNHDLLSFKGMAPDARVRMKEAEVKKAAKAAAKEAAAAQKAQEAEAGENSAEDAASSEGDADKGGGEA